MVNTGRFTGRKNRIGFLHGSYPRDVLRFDTSENRGGIWRPANDPECIGRHRRQATGRVMKQFQGLITGVSNNGGQPEFLDSVDWFGTCIASLNHYLRMFGLELTGDPEQHTLCGIGNDSR